MSKPRKPDTISGVLIINKHAGTVRARLSRSRKLLKDMLKSGGNEKVLVRRQSSNYRCLIQIGNTGEIVDRA